MAYAAVSRSHHEPYTMYPNRYNDVIKPELTDTQKDVCDVVIRMTYGWHRNSARISNAAFIAKTGKSEQAIIKAKSQLEQMGLLVVLEHGGGSKTALYMLNLYYDDADGAAKESAQHRAEQIQQPPVHVLQDDSLDAKVLTQEQQDTADDSKAVEHDTGVPDVSETQMHNDKTACITSDDEVTAPDCLHTDPTTCEPAADVTSCSPTEPPTSDEPDYARADICEQGSADPDIPDTTSAPDPITIEESEAPTPNLRLAPPKDIKNSIIYINKHTEAASEDVQAADADAGTGRKRQVATVRYEFLKLFPDAAQDDDWPLFGWAVSTYGADMCLDKLRLLCEYRKQHEVGNPKGMFRMALTRDYQPSKGVRARLRAEEAAKAARERSCRESAEWEDRVQAFSYESAAASLSKLMEALN